jgi:hypothetical protein
MYLQIKAENKTVTGRAQGQAVDLFLRNFFIKHKMADTLNNFQQ